MESMSENTTFHGIIGDVNPIEHDGGVVFDRGNGPEVLYFQGWTDEYGEDRVTVFEFTVVEELDWVDWDSVSRSYGIYVDELKALGRSPDVLARAEAYNCIASYYGFRELDPNPRELTLEKAEREFGEFVDQAS